MRYVLCTLLLILSIYLFQNHGMWGIGSTTLAALVFFGWEYRQVWSEKGRKDDTDS